MQLRARKGLTVLVGLTIASCGPSPKPQSPPFRQDDARLRQCLADLRSQHVAFDALPDRRFGGGCSAVGTIRLLDIGTPVSNLGPMTCSLARAFAGWTRGAVQPAARRWLGVSVRKMESFGTYSCRGVNGQPGARLSEHGRANAVDIGAFLLSDGRRITVVEGWHGPDESVRRFLREVFREGCRRFAIGLGPDANAYHRDHLHFDMGEGPYCR